MERLSILNSFILSKIINYRSECSCPFPPYVVNSLYLSNQRCCPVQQCSAFVLPCNSMGVSLCCNTRIIRWLFNVKNLYICYIIISEPLPSGIFYLNVENDLIKHMASAFWDMRQCKCLISSSIDYVVSQLIQTLIASVCVTVSISLIS